MLRIRCPKCREEMTLPNDKAGSIVFCSGCGKQIRIPASPPVSVQPLPDANGLEEINDVLPREHRRMLNPGERAYYFAWIESPGGCAQQLPRWASTASTSTSTEEQYILVTDQRVVYEAKVQEGDPKNPKYVHASGSIPIPKISFVSSLIAETPPQGCNPVQEMYLLRISSSGGSVDIPFLSEKRAKRVRRVIEEVIGQ